MKSSLVYKFTWASCTCSYIGEICRHFKTRIDEHIKKDNKSHIFKHLHSIATCFDSYNYLCFKIIDKANYKFDLKIKEALHINWNYKPNLNEQQNHLALTLSLKSLFPLLLSVFVCFSFVVFCNPLSSKILCRVPYIISLLSSNAFIISKQIIGTFYCLNYAVLLLHFFITDPTIDFIITM